MLSIYKIITIYFLIALFSYLFLANFDIKSDGILYYAVDEAFYNSELSIENEIYLDAYLHKRSIGLPHSDKFKLATPYSPVSALFYYPFFLISDLLKDCNFLKLNDLLFSPLYKIPFRRLLSIWIANIFFLFLSLITIHIIIKKIFSYEDKKIIFIIILFFFGTHWLCYATFYYFFLHNLEIFLSSLFLLIWLKKKFDSHLYFIILGFLFSLLVGIRYINFTAYFILALYSMLKAELSIKKILSFIRAISLFLIGSIPIIILLFYYNYNILGGFLKSGYTSHQFLTNLSLGETIISVLRRVSFYYFHPLRGLFIWHPLFLMGFIGILYSNIDKKIKLLIISSLILFTFGLSFYIAWWAGNSFGQRYFLINIPFYIIGFGYFFKKINKALLSVCSLIFLYSLFLYFLYLGNANKANGEFFTPFTMIDYFMKHPDAVKTNFKYNTFASKFNPLKWFLNLNYSYKLVKFYNAVSFEKKEIKLPLPENSKKLIFIFQLYLNKEKRFPKDILFSFHSERIEMHKKDGYLILSDLGFPSPYLRAMISSQELKLFGWFNYNNLLSETNSFLILGLCIDSEENKILYYYEVEVKNPFKAYEGIYLIKGLLYDSSMPNINRYKIKAEKVSNIFLYWQAKGGFPFLIEQFSLKEGEISAIPKGIKSLSRQQFKGLLWILSDSEIRFLDSSDSR